MSNLPVNILNFILQSVPLTSKFSVNLLERCPLRMPSITLCLNASNLQDLMHFLSRWLFKILVHFERGKYSKKRYGAN